MMVVEPPQLTTIDQQRVSFGVYSSSFSWAREDNPELGHTTAKSTGLHAQLR